MEEKQMIETALIANKLYEKVKLSEGTSLDQIAVKVIRNDCPEFFAAYEGS